MTQEYTNVVSRPSQFCVDSHFDALLNCERDIKWTFF